MMEIPKTTVKPAIGDMNILVVDDQPEMRELLKTILRTLRVENMYSASDGNLAIEQFGKSQFEMVFLDIDMPGLDGFSTLEQIRQRDPNAFVVMVSGHSSIDNVKKSLQMGASGFVVKPYTSSKIGEMLRKWREAK